jgi:hypothetical protein
MERVDVLSRALSGSTQTPVSRFLDVDEVAAESSED